MHDAVGTIYLEVGWRAALTVGVPKKLGHNRQGNSGFYDPQLGVAFLHSAGDSRDDGTIWVYAWI